MKMQLLNPVWKRWNSTLIQHLCLRYLPDVSPLLFHALLFILYFTHKYNVFEFLITFINSIKLKERGKIPSDVPYRKYFHHLQKTSRLGHMASESPYCINLILIIMSPRWTQVLRASQWNQTCQSFSSGSVQYITLMWIQFSEMNMCVFSLSGFSDLPGQTSARGIFLQETRREVQ